MITSFSFCPKSDYSTINDSIGNVVLNLKYEKEERLNPHYYLSHFIYTNRKEKSSNDIQTIYEILQKDTVLKDELKYAIRVVPYTGI